LFARASKPGEKLNIAVIGVNNRGGENLKSVEHENIVALCDVDESWSAKAREKFPKALFFTDYRKMFDRLAKEIDAVVVSTPDHSHALPAALAMNLGKHVYCEKPLAPSVNETRYLRKLAAEQKLVTQMGS
jgi:predicted dehydrogenase